MKKQLYLFCASLMPLMLCSGMVYSIFSIYIREDLEATVTQIGIIYMLSSITGMISAPFFGKLSDKIGRKPIIVFSIASFSLVFLFYAISRSFMDIFYIQILEGATWAAIGVAAPAFLADIAKEQERGKFMGVYTQTWYAGWAAGPLLGGFLADTIGFRYSFIICSLMLVLALLLVLIFVKEHKVGEEK